MKREDKLCVWVLELAVFSVNSQKIAYWEIWEAFNTRSEAVAKRRYEYEFGDFKHGKVPERFWRIRKYIPVKP